VTVTAPRPVLAPPLRRRGRRRDRIARLERPLLLAGLALVTLHLLDLAVSGPDTSILGVLAILGVPAGWAFAQPRVTRPTRVLLGIVIGLLAFGFGVISHGLHVVNSGLDARDVTGVGMIVGGLLLVAAGLTAITARRRPPRRTGLGWRAAHAAGWLVGAAVVMVGVMCFAFSLQITHAPRWAIQESSLGIPHEEVVITTADGRKLSAWYVPSRNHTAVLLSHGSGGSRERLVAHIRMLARHGYGVLALDNPGNGESEGHSNGLGDNAQPGIHAALGWLSRRPDVDPRRIAAFGTSLGGEVVLEAAARDPRIRAVVSDGAARPQDSTRAAELGPAEKAVGFLTMQIVRGVSGTHSAPSLFGLMPRIAPGRVLLIAGGAIDEEVITNRHYQADGGENVELWIVPGTGHTAGLRTHPAAYEERTTAFLDRTLGLSAE
jgi:pimeloyl-ACP methyl ester carboxylesterase